MHGRAVLLSFGILNAVRHTYAATAISEAKHIHSGGAEANENNGSTDSSPHKGGFEDRDFIVDQQQDLTDTLSCFPASLEQGTISDACQQSFNYGAMGSVEQQSHFKKIQSFKVDYTEAEVTQYESQRTGMRVSVVDRKGPKVCLLLSKLDLLLIRM